MTSRAWQDRRGYHTYRNVIRPGVLARDGYRCQIRLEGEWPVRGGMARCRGVADCVHHTLGRGVTGDDPRYMVAACSPCNHKVGDPTRRADPPVRPSGLW